MPSQYRCDVAFELKIGKSGGTNLTQRYERRTSSHISSFSSGVYPSTGICFYNNFAQSSVLDLRKHFQGMVISDQSGFL